MASRKLVGICKGAGGNGCMAKVAAALLAGNRQWLQPKPHAQMLRVW